MERWFGKSWGAACCEVEAHAPTPIGRPCMQCREPIREGDQGLVHPYVRDWKHEPDGDIRFTMEPVHLDCFLRTIRPHGPECPHCRGLEPRFHAAECQRSETGLCTCIPMPGAE